MGSQMIEVLNEFGIHAAGIGLEKSRFSFWIWWDFRAYNLYLMYFGLLGKIIILSKVLSNFC